ncbi:MAG TPA: FIST N-terminal domain-containing protein [Dehalococcoidia bacterium]|nr:FIST N-terminal domain-containing protein [Dehalococcoidia bacterium]
MKIEQTSWTVATGWSPSATGGLEGADLVLVFAGGEAINQEAFLQDIHASYPAALVFGCSTAGEILDTNVRDDSASITAVQFEGTTLDYAGIDISQAGDSFDAGKRLADSIPHDGLVHVFVLSDGIHVNGSEVVRGLAHRLPATVGVTGGLAGDGDRFQETTVIHGMEKTSGHIGLLGLYGPHIRIGYASLGGWDSFGPERLITRSEGNILYELDGKSALDLYKTYLGEHAAGLPATGLLFPLSLRTDDGTPVVRTILGVDEAGQSMTFAGDMPEGAYARLMKANFDRLVDGASDAAQTCLDAVGDASPDLAILVSCVGRKMVLKQRIEEEVEAVRDVLGDKAVLAGFYSYGEISPFTPNARCELHNQTMTITTLSERAA